MRYPSILLWCALVLVGCGESAAEKQARQAEEQETRRQVALAMPTDRMSLYLINQAENRCKTHPVHECSDIATLGELKQTSLKSHRILCKPIASKA